MMDRSRTVGFTTSADRSETPRTHVVVELEAADVFVAAAWDRAGFWERASELGDEIHALVPGSLTLPRNVSRLAGREALALADNDAVVLIDGRQLLLESRPATAFLETWRSTGRGYGTQWEHSRLPVGVGVRVATGSALASAPGELFSEAFLHLAVVGDDSFYDPVAHCDYETSRIEARVMEPGTLGAIWPALIEEGEERFTHPVAEAVLQNYQPTAADREAACVDERGMAARYGFESAACAEYPTYVMFDMTNVCNAKCTHCPHGIPEMRDSMLGNATRIDAQLFKQVIDECVGRELDFVRVTADGEPLLHKELFDLIRYGKDRGVGPIGLTTNASLLDERRAGMLLDSGVDMVDISLDALTEDTYKVVRVGLRHDRVYANIHRLLEMRAERNAPLKVIVSFVEQESNRHEAESFRSYWEEHVDQVVVREMISNVNLNEVDRDDRVAETDRWPCPHWFRRVVINYDGWLKACPIDWTGDTKVVELSKMPIHAIWHGEHYWKNRLEHLNRMFSPDSACAPCNDWLGTPWNLGYEKMVKGLDIPQAEQGPAPLAENAFDV